MARTDEFSSEDYSGPDEMEHNFLTEYDWQESKRQYWAELGDFELFIRKTKKRWDRERRSELSLLGIIADYVLSCLPSTLSVRSCSCSK
jgi:hypothetical protein